MASYKDTKTSMMEMYPSLFTDELDVLEHLFFVIGNGYDWVNGELVDTSKMILVDGRAMERKIINDQIEWEKAHGTSMVKYWEKKLACLDEANYPKNERRRERRRRLASVKERGSCFFIAPDGSIGLRIYPLCEYSKIMHIPDDVKPDWLAAARKALAYANGPRMRTKPNDRKWLKKAAEYITARLDFWTWSRENG